MRESGGIYRSLEKYFKGKNNNYLKKNFNPNNGFKILPITSAEYYLGSNGSKRQTELAVPATNLSCKLKILITRNKLDNLGAEQNSLPIKHNTKGNMKKKTAGNLDVFFLSCLLSGKQKGRN